MRPIMIMAAVDLISLMIMMVMLIMVQNGHPDLVSTATTCAAHLGHLHAHQGELPACRHFHIGAAALAEQQ